MDSAVDTAPDPRGPGRLSPSESAPQLPPAARRAFPAHRRLAEERLASMIGVVPDSGAPRVDPAARRRLITRHGRRVPPHVPDPNDNRQSVRGAPRAGDRRAVLPTEPAAATTGALGTARGLETLRRDQRGRRGLRDPRRGLHERLAGSAGNEIMSDLLRSVQRAHQGRAHHDFLTDDDPADHRRASAAARRGDGRRSGAGRTDLSGRTWPSKQVAEERALTRHRRDGDAGLKPAPTRTSTPAPIKARGGTG